MSSWFGLALLCAFFESGKDCLFKWKLDSCSPFLLMGCAYIFSMPVTIPWLLMSGLPDLSSQFWWALILASVFEIVAAYLFVKAVSYSQLSLVIPFIAFSPVFLLLWSPLILDETLSVGGVAGVLMIVVGSYLMNVKLSKGGVFKPFAAILNDKGAICMLATAFFWSLNAAICKVGVLHSSPAFWCVSFCFLSAIIASFLLVRTSETWLSDFKANPIGLIALGLFVSGIMITLFSAFELQKAAYVIATKRVSILMTVGLGYFLFKEHDVKERFSGAVVMLLGVVVIAANS